MESKIYYIGDDIIDLNRFNPKSQNDDLLIGVLSHDEKIQKTLLKGIFTPYSKRKSSKWMDLSITNQKAFYYIEDFKIAELLNYNPRTNNAVFYFYTPPKIISKYPYKIFIAMPFDEDLEDNYSTIKNVHKELKITYKELKIFRMDMHTGESIDIPKRIYDEIFESGIIIADVTKINPNVYYEIGVADTLSKKVILISNAASSLPFDLRHRKAIIFKNQTDLSSKLKNDLEAILLNIKNGV